MIQYTIARRPVATSVRLDQNSSSTLVQTEATKVSEARPAHSTTPSSIDEEHDRSTPEAVNREEPSTVPELATNNQLGEETRQPINPIPPHKEWTPMMLRKTSAFSLALVSFTFVGLLELTNWLEQRNQGFPVYHTILRLTAQYLPTILVILLSFAWQMLVVDVKKIAPWAAMTNQWTEPEHSIQANYIDDLEILSVWKSVRRRHWGVLVALLGGLLSGSLTPFAGGLFYVDPFHESTSNVTLIRTSRFEFNGSLSAFDPLTSNVDEPIAALVGNSRFGSLLPPWTSNEYAFESFNMSDLHHNVSLIMKTVAFGGELDCNTLKYNTKVTRKWYTGESAYVDRGKTQPGLMTDVELIPNEEDMIRNNCQIPPAFFPKVTFSRPSNRSAEVFPAATMNVTVCSNTNDMPLTLTIMILLNDKASDTSISFNTAGVLCRPRYITRTVELNVNATTAEIVKIDRLSNTSTPVDIGVNSTRLSGAINQDEMNWVFVQGFLEYMDYYSVVGSSDNYWNNVLLTEDGTGPYTPYTPLRSVGRDPWFSMLSSGNVSKIRNYATNLTTLSIDSAQLFQKTMAQIANFGFRSSDSSPVPGLSKIRQPRITIRRSSLLLLQITLGVLGIVAFCCVTILRPKSCLNEDPATLKALSNIMTSSEDFHRQMMRTGHLDDQCFRRALHGLKVRLNNNYYSKPSIEIQNCTAPVTRCRGDEQQGGYRPLMLNLVARSCLVITFSGALVALGILLRCSTNRSGFRLQTRFKSLAWSYAPNILLVLLEYATEGAGGCARALGVYVALQVGSVSSRKSSLLNMMDRSTFAAFNRSYWQHISWTFLTTSVILLIYPAIKVTAAGLYTNVLGIDVFTTKIWIDQSLVTNLDKLIVGPKTNALFSDVANTFAVWTLTPEMHFPSPSGTEGSLIFSNLTSTSLSSDAIRALNHGGSLSVRMSAIQVNVNCSAYTTADFQIVREGSIVRLRCKSQGCRRYFPETMDGLAEGLPSTAFGWWGGFNRSRAPDSTYVGWLRGWDQSLTDPEDYGSAPISGLFMKIDDYGPDQISATERMNLTPKAIAGYSCVRSLDKVNVNVEFARATQSDLEETSPLSINVASFDERSISPTYNLPSYNDVNVTMNYFRSCVSSSNVTCGTSTSWITPVESIWIDNNLDTLSTTLGATDFQGLLAATQLQYQNSNTSILERLFDPKYLPEAAKEAYTVFTTQFINQLRPLAQGVENNTIPQTATVSQSSLQAVQSRNVTIVLVVLLSIVLACICFALWRVPFKPVIAKAPNSIAAQASLLAGSNLVHRLKEAGVDSVAATNIWKEEVFSLGWWDPNGRQVEEGMHEARWGIDIGVARLRNTLDAGPKPPLKDCLAKGASKGDQTGF